MPSTSADRDVEVGEDRGSSSCPSDSSDMHEVALPSYYEAERERRAEQRNVASGQVGNNTYVRLSPSTNRHCYNDRVGKMAGLLQTLCGSVTAVMGLLALVLHSHDYFLDLPLWAGLLYLFCGVFGISTTKHQTFMVGLYLLFSIMSCMMSAIVMVTEGHATFMEANHCDCSIFQSSHMLYDATAALVSCVELLTASVSTYYCLAGLGCCKCCQSPSREPREISHPPTLLDFSNIPLPPAPIYPVLAPELPAKVPLE